MHPCQLCIGYSNTIIPSSNESWCVDIQTFIANHNYYDKMGKKQIDWKNVKVRLRKETSDWNIVYFDGGSAATSNMYWLSIIPSRLE